MLKNNVINIDIKLKDRKFFNELNDKVKELDKQINYFKEALDKNDFCLNDSSMSKEFYNNLENLGCILVDKYIEVTLVKYKDVILVLQSIGCGRYKYIGSLNNIISAYV